MQWLWLILSPQVVLTLKCGGHSYQSEAIVSVFVASGVLESGGRVVTSLSYSHCATGGRYLAL